MDPLFDISYLDDLPRDLFSKLKEYWDKLITYTFPEQDREDVYGLEESYYGCTYFSKYIDTSEIFPKFRKGILQFIFRINYEYVNRTEIKPKYAFEFDNYFREDILKLNCECHKRILNKYCKNCEITYFIRYILNELSELREDFEDVLEKYKNPDIESKLQYHDRLCIKCYEYYVSVSATVSTSATTTVSTSATTSTTVSTRDINNMNSLYCSKCGYKKNDLDTRVRDYNAYLLVLARRYKSKINSILRFLREPIPLKFDISGYCEDDITLKLYKVSS